MKLIVFIKNLNSVTFFLLFIAMEILWRWKWKLFLFWRNSPVHLKETEVTISLLSEAFSILSENSTRHKSSRFVSQSMAIGFFKSDINWNGVWLEVDFQLRELQYTTAIVYNPVWWFFVWGLHFLSLFSVILVATVL